MEILIRDSVFYYIVWAPLPSTSHVIRTEQ